MAELVAEFARVSEAAEAVKRLRTVGLHDLEAFTPYPSHEVEEALELPRSYIPRACLGGGVAGAAAGYAIQWWTNAVDYPLDVGGRPLLSIPAWIPATFEGAVLGAALATALAMLVAARLPRLWQPVFEVEEFERAGVDRFFVRVAVGDHADRTGIERILRSAGAVRVEPLPVEGEP